MRITNSVLMRNMMFNLNLNQNSMAKYQNRLSRRGQKIFRPSDDPVGISRVLKYTSDVNVLAQFKATAGAADGHNKVTESAVTSIKEILQSIRQNCVAAADYTKTPENIKKYAIEIKELKNELVILGNSSNAGKYIFSGLETDKKLFNRDGSYALNMTAERVALKPVIEHEITEGELIRSGIHPIDIFGLVENTNPLADYIPVGSVRGGATYDAGYFGGGKINDAIIRRATGKESIGVKYTTPSGGTAKELNIELDFDSINDMEALSNKIQEQLDSEFGADNVKVKIEDNEPIKFEVTNGDFSVDKLSGTNPMNDFMPVGEVEATPAKSGQVSMVVDPKDKDFTSYSISVTVNGIQFNIDTGKLKHSYLNKMTKERFVNAFEFAESGDEKLINHADIFFDEDNRFVIRNKKPGSANSVNVSVSSPHISDLQTKAGEDAVSATYDASAFDGKKLDDRTIELANGKHGIVFEYTKPGVKDEAEQVYVELDFDSINTVDDLKTAIQNQLDTKYGAGTITVDATAGNPLKFEIKEGKLKVDSVVGNESELMHDLDILMNALNTGDQETVNHYIDIMDSHLDDTLAVMGEIGGKTIRLDYINQRIEENTLTFTDLMDKLKYADFAEMITMFKNLENVYRASLSVGSRVIQPSLVDFLR